MKWFKHFSDTRNNPKIRAIEKRLGEAGYARAFKLVEIVSAFGGTGDKFQPSINLRTPEMDLNWLADEWKISPDDATSTLKVFAKVRFIDQKSWRHKVVYVPQILEYRDEYSERKRPVKTPESLPSDSRATPVRSRSRVEIEAEAEKSAAAAAASFKEKANSEEWKSIGIAPAGSPEFQGGWKNFYDKSDPSEKLSDLMERFIQFCENHKVPIPIPPPFYKAKHAAEEQERGESAHLPRLVAPY